MWENPVSFQPSPFSSPRTKSRFASFSCKKIGNHFRFSNRFFHRQSTGEDFPRKNPQTFLFHKPIFQEFPQARKSEEVLHKRRKFSKGFRTRLFTFRNSRFSRPPLVFRAFPIFRHTLKPLLLKFFYSYLLRARKPKCGSHGLWKSKSQKINTAHIGSRDLSLALLLVLFLVQRKGQER